MVLTRSARKAAAQQDSFLSDDRLTRQAALADVTNRGDMFMTTPMSTKGKKMDHSSPPPSTVSRVLVREMTRLGLATPRPDECHQAVSIDQGVGCVTPQALRFDANEIGEDHPATQMHADPVADFSCTDKSDGMDTTFNMLASPSVAQNLLHVRQQQAALDQTRPNHESDIMSVLGAGFAKAPAYLRDAGSTVPCSEGEIDMTNPCTPEPQAPMANFCVVGHEISKQWKGQHVIFDMLGLSKVKVVAERVAFDASECNTGSTSGSESVRPGQDSSGCSPARIKRAMHTVPVQALAFEDDDDEDLKSTQEHVARSQPEICRPTAQWCGTHIVYTDEESVSEVDENSKRTDSSVAEIQGSVEKLHISRKGNSQGRNVRVKSARSFAWL